MKTMEEILEEIIKLTEHKDTDESGLVVRIITLTALSWVVGACPIPPSKRLKEISGEILEGAFDKGADGESE